MTDYKSNNKFIVALFSLKFLEKFTTYEYNKTMRNIAELTKDR